VVMAKAAVDRLRDPAGVPEGEKRSPTIRMAASGDLKEGTPSGRAMQIAEQTIAELARRTQATAGLILLDREGNPGYAFNTPRMAYGYVAVDGTLITGV
jgi:isoaspartyl peptidase/L-asparaginase-like protein (Ntn-hydrolase superfamily)